MAWKKVLDDFTGAVPKATDRAWVAGMEHTHLLIDGDDGGATGALKGVITIGASEKVADLWKPNKTTASWIQWTASEEGCLVQVPCRGLDWLYINFTGGTGLVGLSVWIWSKEQTS